MQQTLKPSDTADALAICIQARQPAIIWGPPGIGKSAIAQQTGAVLGREILDLRASLLDAVDLRGIPQVDQGVTRWRPPSFLPADDGVKRLLLLDELNRAPVMVQNGLLQLVLDRKLGEYTLPDTCEIVACCNRESDGGGVSKMPQAMANRFEHLHMTEDLDDWSRWAVRSYIEPAVIAFLRFKPTLLFDFSAKEKAFPTPRSWEFVSRIVAQSPKKSIERALYAGAVGDGAAIEFSAFLELFRTLPNIDAILLDPANAPVPERVETLFAVSCAIAQRSTVQTFDRALTYMNRLPQEYCIYGVQDAVRRDHQLTATPAFTRWAIEHADVIF